MAGRNDGRERAPPRRQQQDYDEPAPRRRSGSGYQRQGIGEAVAKSFIRSIASSLGRILAKTLTGRMR
jgi:hypothetical protein